MEIRPTHWKITDVTNEELWVIYKSLQVLKFEVIPKNKRGWSKDFIKRVENLHNYLKNYEWEW